MEDTDPNIAIHADLYLKKERIEQLCALLNIPIVERRTFEKSADLEGSASGGVFGFLTGMAKASKGNRTRDEILLTDDNRIQEIIKKAGERWPGGVFRITKRNDWQFLAPEQPFIFSAYLNLKKVVSPGGLFWRFYGDAYGSKVEIRFSSFRSGGNTFYGNSVQCFGQISSVENDNSLLIRPISVGYARSFDSKAFHRETDENFDEDSWADYEEDEDEEKTTP